MILRALITRHKHQLPNWLTFSRIVVLCPIALLLSYWTTPLGTALATILAVYAMITDYMDGYLSRKWGVVSDIGRLLDPVADKLLIATLLILLSARGYGHPLAVTLILLREIGVSALREYAQERRIVLHVTKTAKYKTTLQMIAAGILLIAGIVPHIDALHYTAEGLLWGAAILTCYTGIDYARGLIHQLHAASGQHEETQA